MKQAKIEWQQGRPVSHHFGDIYFSREDGVAESDYVFLKNNGLPERWLNCDQFVIAETGFGTGLNFLITLKRWLETAPSKAQLHYYSVEKYPLAKNDLQKALQLWPDYKELAEELIAAFPPAVRGFHPLYFSNQRVTLVLMLGDVEEMLRQMPATVDAWYLDGFAPGKNPDMWSGQVFQQIAMHSHYDTGFSTFTAVGDVRRGLAEVGFEVSRVKGFASKREMLVGRMKQPETSVNTLPWFQPALLKFKSKRVAVIGAGIAGVTTAWSLARRGWQVKLIEKHGDIAQEASGNPLGVLMPRLTLGQSVEGEFYAAAFFVMLNLLNRLKQVDDSFSWQDKGVLQLASSERIKKQIEKLDMPETYVRRVSAREASELSGLDLQAEALFFENAGWFRPQDLCQRMLMSQSENIQQYTDTRVTQLTYENNVWQLTGADKQVIEVDAVVIANATQVADFQQTGFLQLQKARGQISYLPVNQQSNNLRCAVCYEGYILPGQAGRHIVGATFDTNNLSLEINQDDHLKNITTSNLWLNQLFENIDIKEVEGRVGLRATTNDRMPVVGAVPDVNYYQQQYNDLYKGKAMDKYPEARYLPGLYVNVGHGARGLTSSLLSAELLAAELNYEPLPVSYKVQHALHPARFLIRKFKKGK